MFKLELKTLNSNILKIYKNFLVILFKKFNISYTWVTLPNKKQRLTLLTSPHVHKTAREQFEFTKFKHVVYLSPNCNFQLLQFLILNKPFEIKLVLKKIT